MKSRGYVMLMGLGGTDPWDFLIQERAMKKDPKAAFVNIYPQNASLHIEQISEKFLAHMDDLLREHPVEELVLFGSSAGGVTASYSISRLHFSGPVALHTLASPIKGYDLTGFRAAFIGDRQGYLRDIAVGFEPFDPPGPNVRVYHHKTVTDSVLKDYCGNMQDFCDVLKIQNNNIKGSKEFYYPQYDHSTIMTGVIFDVLRCYEIPGLKELQEQFHNLSALRLGDLCMGEQMCNIFCKDRMGRCKQYCAEHPENPLCQRPFGFENSSDHQG